MAEVLVAILGISSVMAAQVATGLYLMFALLQIGIALGTASKSKAAAAIAADRGMLVNTMSTNEVLPVVYGRRRVGGNRVYAGISGEDNKILHIVTTLSEGEIEGAVKRDKWGHIKGTNCRVATTVSGTLATSFCNGKSVDGVTLVTGNRILIKNQVDQTENGVYKVNATGAPTRDDAVDYTYTYASWVFNITSGTVNAGKWFYNEQTEIEYGVTNVTFIEPQGTLNNVEWAAPVDQVFLADKLYTDFGSYFYYEIFTGTSTQNVCATLQAAVPEWDSAMRYTSYIYTQMKYDPNVFMGIPEITVEINGLKVYNPATGVTEFTHNPALHSRDFLTRSSRRGGLGISSLRIDDNYITDSANYCLLKGWTCDLGLKEATSAIDNLKDILSTFRGTCIRSSSNFRVQYRDLNYEAPVMTLNENDILEVNGASSLKITQPSIFNTPNAVCMKYISEEKKYTDDDYVLPDPVAVAADGDYRELDIAVPGITCTPNIQKMANYFLERLRVNKTASMVVGVKGMSLEPEDLTNITHSRPGWSNKVMRVTQPAVTQEGTVGLALEEESEDFYDDVYNAQQHNYHDTNLPDPSATVVPVRNVTLTEENYVVRNRTFTRLKCDFDPPLTTVYPWWDSADVYLKIGDGEWKFMTTAVTNYYVDPVEEGQVYSICLVSKNIWGVKQAFADGFVVSKTVEGKTDLPTSLTGVTALAHGDNLSIFATPVSDPDVEVYEVRFGTSWEGGLFMGSNREPNIKLVGVRPGTYTVWMNVKDTSGRYGETPVSTEVIVYYPANYVDKATWTWNFRDWSWSISPSNSPSVSPSASLSPSASESYSNSPSTSPSASVSPSVSPSASPSISPSESSSISPSPSESPSVSPSISPSESPSTSPSESFSESPSISPSPSESFSESPSISPSPSESPSVSASTSPSKSPSLSPSVSPSYSPSAAPAGAFINTEHCIYDSTDALKCSHLDNNLTGIWISPIYDLGSVQTLRLWGDFLTSFVGSGALWSDKLGVGTTWAEILGEGSKWYDLFTSTVAATITAKLRWGDTEALGNEVSKFEVLAPEIRGRYVQVEVTINDPDLTSHLYLKELHMTAAYWE